MSRAKVSVVVHRVFALVSVRGCFCRKTAGRCTKRHDEGRSPGVRGIVESARDGFHPQHVERGVYTTATRALYGSATAGKGRIDGYIRVIFAGGGGGVVTNAPGNNI